MLGAAFLIVAVAVIATGHYLRVHSPGRISAEGPARETVPVHSLIDRLPRGVFVQPTFTWGHVRPSGDVELGVHPMLLALAGPDAEVLAPEPGSKVSENEELLTIRAGDRSMAVRSPIAGRVAATQAQSSGATDWDDLATRRGQWSVVLVPESISEALPSWMIGRSAIDWTRGRYRAMRDYFVSNGPGHEIGLAMADGGDIPGAALDACDQAAWDDFAERFLAG
jgi:glycine cleavage system H lipoate-binding protein